MNSVMICCKRFKERLNAENIQSEYQEVQTKRYCKRTIVSIVSDNASNTVKAFSLFGSEVYQELKIDWGNDTEEESEAENMYEDNKGNLAKHMSSLHTVCNLLLKTAWKSVLSTWKQY